MRMPSFFLPFPSFYAKKSVAHIVLHSTPNVVENETTKGKLFSVYTALIAKKRSRSEKKNTNRKSSVVIWKMEAVTGQSSVAMTAQKPRR